MTMTTLTIILMATITFATRYIFIHPKLPVRLGPKMSAFLSFSAPAVLTAIWVPIIFVHDRQLNLSVTNPYLIGAIVAVVIARKTNNIYFTLFGSAVFFTGLQILNLT